MTTIKMNNQLLLKNNNNIGVAPALLLCFTIFVLSHTTNAIEYPTPPPVPKSFSNAQEVQRYLNQLHNYYTVVGRPR
jgi:hypothetical protein